MRIQITFKSGAQIEADVDEFETGRNPATSGLTRLKWTTPTDWSAKLHTLDVAEVVAVVALRTAAGDLPSDHESAA